MMDLAAVKAGILDDPELQVKRILKDLGGRSNWASTINKRATSVFSMASTWKIHFWEKCLPIFITL
jgi:hypothetical protein